MTPRALTIAGSDSGGGAGIQADLKAFARCGVHGTCAITAITAQNTLHVRAIHPVPTAIVLAQIRAVAEDIGVQAVKVGMLGTTEITRAVARALDELPAGTPVVVDPVMIAESGARLLQVDAQQALIEEILPRATVLTPNLPEARALAGWDAAGAGREGAEGGEGAEVHEQAGIEGAGPQEQADIEGAGPQIDIETAQVRELLRAVLALGPRTVVLTGGHRPRAVDLFIDGADGQVVEIPGERHSDGASHGSGCTHSSVLAARLALGDTPLQAARAARMLAGRAVANGLRDVGAGAGPVDVLGLAGLRES
jgi:hydroxymethylpyrimidine/phosphomethylpyrimidine kinase